MARLLSHSVYYKLYLHMVCLPNKKEKKKWWKNESEETSEPLKITFKVLKNENLGALAPACTGV